MFLSFPHLEEGNAFALVEDEVLVNEGRLCGHAFVTSAQLLFQRVLDTMKRREEGAEINKGFIKINQGKPTIFLAYEQQTSRGR